MSFFGSLFGNSDLDQSSPISLVFKNTSSNLSFLGTNPSIFADAVTDITTLGTQVKTFGSYSFERNMLSPATPFRFTAPGIDKKTRMSIRSGCTVQLMANLAEGKQTPIATGFIDETDTHISAGRVEYVLTGRDTLGQLVDNTVVDNHNKIVQLKSQRLSSIVEILIKNTRMPQQYVNQNMPDANTLLFQTIPGETKINTLQRYLELTNSLIWTLPNGQAVIGKPNFNKTQSGILTVGTLENTSSIQGNSLPQSTNVLDCRVRRNLNTAIRQIVVQLQNLNRVDPGAYTINNQDQDMRTVAADGVGRSVYNLFSYGSSAETVNLLKAVGNFSGNPSDLGAAYAMREIARENIKILEVEITVQGHLNSNGNIYDVDQIYFVNIPDEDISDKMYCYAVNHELTLDHGMISKLRLCKVGGTLVAGTPQMPVITASTFAL